MTALRELGLVPNKPLQQMMISGLCIVMNEPHVDQIDIYDIAYALSRTARYAGNTRGEPYSVAQHSVEVCDVVAEAHPDDLTLQLAALLHDAGEAPLIDVPYPVKKSISGFDELENSILACIERKYMLPPGYTEHEAVKSADWTTHQREVRDLLPHPRSMTPTEYWGYDPDSIEGSPIYPLEWGIAQGAFVARFNDLWNRLETLRNCAV